MITGLAAASQNGRNAIRVRELFRGSRVLVFPSLDTVGVQVCAASKNIVAVAFGMLDAIASQGGGRLGPRGRDGARPPGPRRLGRVRRQHRVPPPRGRAQRDAGPRHGPGRFAPRDLHFDRGSGRPRRDLPLRARAQPPLRPRDRREGILAPFRDLDDLLGRITELGYLPEGAVACKHVAAIAAERNLDLPIMGGVDRILDRRSEPLQFLEEYLAHMGASPSGVRGPSLAPPPPNYSPRRDFATTRRRLVFAKLLIDLSMARHRRRSASLPEPSSLARRKAASLVSLSQPE